MLRLAWLIFLTMFSHAVGAQSTLGDLQAMKAVKTPAQTIEERTQGSTTDTTTPAGYPVRVSYEKGGKAYSVVETPTGPRQFTGKWWVEGDGKRCVQMSGNPQSCLFLFSTESGIFVARSDTDVSAPIRKLYER